MTSSAAIWEALVRERRVTTDRSDVAGRARAMGKIPDNALRHLRRAGLLVPLFRGWYYVPGPEEARLGIPRHNHLELFALGARQVRIGHWYYGLESALRYHGMSLHHSREETVISDRMFRVKGIRIAHHRFRVLRWSPRLCREGLERHGLLRVSDPAKTVLDLAYREYFRLRRHGVADHVWREHVGSVDRRLVVRYLRRYPPAIAAEVAPWI